MMNGSKRSIIEQLIIFTLYVLALPFILTFLVLYIVFYLLVYPFEKTIYIKSSYYKNLKEKYYVLITTTKSYKKYNEIVKMTRFNEQSKRYENDRTILMEMDAIIDQNDFFDLEKIKTKLNIKQELYLLVDKNKVDKDILEKIKLLNYIILYES